MIVSGISTQKPRLAALQALRGLAAILVVIDHAILTYLERFASPISKEAAWFLGAMGVHTFFIISGFVMIYVHGQDFSKSGSSIRFISKRVMRIVPLYWIITIVFFINRIRKEDTSFLDLILSFTFIPYSGSDSFGRPILTQGWTLNYEMFFYIMFAISLFFKNGLYFLISILFSFSLAHLLGLFSKLEVINFWSDPIIVYFISGIIIGKIRPYHIRFYQAILFATVALAISCILAIIYGYNDTVTVIVEPLAVSMAVLACTWSISIGKSSLFERGAEFIGDTSFSLYLTHTAAISIFSRLVFENYRQTNFFLFLSTSVVFAIIIGGIVSMFLERPLMRILKQVRPITKRVA